MPFITFIPKFTYSFLKIGTSFSYFLHGGVVDGMDGRASMRGMSRCSNFSSCFKCVKCIMFIRCAMYGRCIRRSRCYITKVVTKNCGRYNMSGRNV